MINSVCGIRSTGRICTDIAEILEANGHECKIAYGREEVPQKHQKYAVRIGNKASLYGHALKARLFDCAGFGSSAATRKLIAKIKEYNPDIIHLHNLHGYYIHVGLLFKFLREYGKPILWSFYDCWSFTGHCAHFDFNACEQWKTGCHKCPHKKDYPASICSRAQRNYQAKRSLFTGLSNLQIIVPSRWMQKMVSQSYMQQYPVHVFPNGIDLASFIPPKTEFRKKWGLQDKFLVLGVSSFWNKMKGLEYFNRLAEELDREKFQVVLVGQAEKGSLSNNVFHVSATNNIQELCELYTAADIFVNPTLQETQGLTTVEALACGIPAIVFNSGGAAECVDETCGIVVERGDYQNLLNSVLRVQSGEVKIDKQDCIRVAQKYEAQRLYKEFMRLYEDAIESKNLRGGVLN